MSILDELSAKPDDRMQNGNKAVAARVRADLSLLAEIAVGLDDADIKIVGHCAEIFTMTAETAPEAVVPYLPKLVPLLASKNTRVRWESTHALALVARHAPEVVASVEAQLDQAIRQDSSVIVRDYAILALGEYASTGAAAARSVFPILSEALTVWEAHHTALALEALGKAAHADETLAPRLIPVAGGYAGSQKASVKRVARATLRSLGQKP